MSNAHRYGYQLLVSAFSQKYGRTHATTLSKEADIIQGHNLCEIL